jgi:hypothetical protein
MVQDSLDLIKYGIFNDNKVFLDNESLVKLTNNIIFTNSLCILY